ncbi:ovate family protein 14 [Hibiscus trionum]|uniref:Transcription repressor n=1 Tax=Hibiscus trionum TaxID=183268 RepID=A0A9W7LY07_HIBTR|nr:ovate family protein 14 [Hibiscus trionum]
MSKKLQKSLQDYLSKIKTTSPNIQFPSKPVSSSKKWILKRCRHPKTLSFAVNPASDHGNKGTSDGNNDDAATLADVDRFLFENFKSLYIEEDDEVEERRCTVRSEDHGDDHIGKSSDAFSLDSPSFMDPPVYVCGSNRFFVSTGMSSSLVEESRSRSSAGTNSTMSISENMGSTSTSSASINNTIASNDFNSDGGVEGDDVNVVSLSNIRNECIAVLTYSHNPYDDFRRSMQEMVEARLKRHSNIDWDFMQELVFCYLKLNDKKSHKFILSAFVDLVVDLRRNDMKIPARSPHFEVNNEREHTRSRRTRHHVM